MVKKRERETGLGCTHAIHSQPLLTSACILLCCSSHYITNLGWFGHCCIPSHSQRISLILTSACMLLCALLKPPAITEAASLCLEGEHHNTTKQPLPSCHYTSESLLTSACMLLCALLKPPAVTEGAALCLEGEPCRCVAPGEGRSGSSLRVGLVGLLAPRL